MTKQVLLWFLVFFSTLMTVRAQEICDNAIDDDGDGLIDMNDIDCQCEEFEQAFIPNPSFEDIVECPLGRAEEEKATPWVRILDQGTTDLYNTNCDYKFDDILAAQGSSYLGMLIYDVETNNRVFSENIAVHLPIPLEKNKSYTIKVRVNSGLIERKESEDILTLHSWVNPMPDIELAVWGANQYIPLKQLTSDIQFVDNLSVLKKVSYSPSTIRNTSDWDELVFTFTPTYDVKTLCLGSSESAPEEFVKHVIGGNNTHPYFLIDDIILEEEGQPIDDLFYINQIGSLCSLDKKLIMSAGYPVDQQTQLQWYFEGVALVGETSTTLDVTQEGEYTLTLHQGNDCKSSSVTIQKEIPTIPVDDVSVNPAFCNQNDGSILFPLSMGGHFQFSIDGGQNWQTGIAFYNLFAGVYQLMVKDENGCESDIEVVSFGNFGE